MKPLVSRREARAMMKHIEALLEFLGINFDPSTLRPTWTVPKVGHLEHGGMRRGILDALRQGNWLTYRDIGKTIVANRRLQLTPKQFHDFLQKLAGNVCNEAAGHCVLQAQTALRRLPSYSTRPVISGNAQPIAGSVGRAGSFEVGDFLLYRLFFRGGSFVAHLAIRGRPRFFEIVRLSISTTSPISTGSGAGRSGCFRQ